jgi:hypothetical protein
MDFVKRPEEQIVIADWFTASTVLIRSTGDLQKMWAKNQVFEVGDESAVPSKRQTLCLASRFQPSIRIFP